METTRTAIDALYEAFMAGDSDAMLDLMSDDVEVCFLGQVDVQGNGRARAFFACTAGLLDELDFRIERTLIDGERAAVTWSETARTWDGLPWENHGVDVLRVQHDHITMLHGNSDVGMVHRHFPHYEV